MECAICLEQYKEPKVLLCRHSYCKECLEKLVKKSGPNYTITCPECRNVTEIRETTFEVLCWDLSNNNVPDNRSSTTKADGLQRVCENCDSGEQAVKNCRVCCMQMCAFCTVAHRRTRTTKRHSLTSLENPKTTTIPPNKKSTYCDKHMGEIVKYFCQSPSCNHVVCRECLLVDHRDHEHDLVYNVAAMKQITIRKLIDDIKCKTKHIQGVVSTLEELEEETLQIVKCVNKEIDGYVDEIIQLLERKRCSLKEDVKVISETKTKQLKIEKDKVAVTLACLKSSVEFTERVLDNSDDVEFLLLEEALAQRLNEHKLKEVSTIQTKALEIAFETTCPKIKQFVEKIAQVSESSNIKDVIYPSSENCTCNSHQQENQQGVPNDADALFYDDLSHDYYNLVPSEVEKLEGFSKNIIDSSTYHNLCTSEHFKDSDDFLSVSTSLSHQGNAEALPQVQSPSRFSRPYYAERTCASMCEVYRLPGSYSFDKLQLTPQKRKFVLQAKTKDGLLQKTSGDKVCVTIENSNGEKENLVVFDNSDGSYNFDYTPQRCGKYTFYITVNGQNVKEKGFGVRNCFRIISDRGL